MYQSPFYNNFICVHMSHTLKSFVAQAVPSVNIPTRDRHAERNFCISNAYHWNNGEFSSMLSSLFRCPKKTHRVNSTVSQGYPSVSFNRGRNWSLLVDSSSLKTRAGVFGMIEKKFTARGSEVGEKYIQASGCTVSQHVLDHFLW